MQKHSSSGSINTTQELRSDSPGNFPRDPQWRGRRTTAGWAPHNSQRKQRRAWRGRRDRQRLRRGWDQMIGSRSSWSANPNPGECRSPALMKHLDYWNTEQELLWMTCLEFLLVAPTYKTKKKAKCLVVLILIFFFKDFDYSFWISFKMWTLPARFII